ncbi:MAG: hypothetical protein K2X47_14315 [Bdellovibrionales bacterium]|nr:hypothetical protein [Bdellovibrionales bacterium]
MINNQRGGITIIVMAVVAGIMAMTLGATYAYVSNRARWQARIRDAYRLNFVVESMAKYIKDASDRYNSCVDGTGANICGASCLTLGPASQYFFLETVPPITVPVTPFRRMCFTKLPECNAVQNSAGLGIKFLDNAAVGGQTIYCMTRANVGDLVINHDPAAPLSQIESSNSEFYFAAAPLRTKESAPTLWEHFLYRFDQWAGADIHSAMAAVNAGDLTYRPKPWLFSLINKSEAFMKNSLYTAAPPTTGLGFTITRGPDYSAAPACSAAVAGLIDEQCLRRCLPNRPCMTFALCPSIIPGCGADGLGAGPGDNSLLVRSTVIVLGMGDEP